jgi:hypothetical protein
MGLLRNSGTSEVEEENELESVALDLLISHMTMTQTSHYAPKELCYPNFRTPTLQRKTNSVTTKDLLNVQVTKRRGPSIRGYFRISLLTIGSRPWSVCVDHFGSKKETKQQNPECRSHEATRTVDSRILQDLSFDHWI